MRCSEFRDQHCSFVDDTLAGVELIRMQRHVAECWECAAHDAKVRRSLMLVRSIPSIVLSPGFSRNLEERLRVSKGEPDSVAGANFRAVAAVGALASLLMLGYVASALYRTGAPDQDIVFPPVIAMASPPQPDIIIAQPALSISPPNAITSSIPVGLPNWPVTATAFAEQTPLHFVRYQEVH